MFQVAEVSIQQRNNAAFSQWGYVFVVIVLATFGIIGMHMCKHEVNYEPDGKYPRSNPNLQGNAEKLNFLGGCFARMSSCSWCLALGFGILGALFALMFLPLTVVVSDACPVLETLPQQLGNITKQPTVQSIADTCWDETGNLFEGFDLDDVISIDDIDFGDLENSLSDPEVDDTGLTGMIDLLDEMRRTDQDCYYRANNNNNVAKLNESIAFAQQNVAWVKTNFSEDQTAKNIADGGKKIVEAVDTSVCQFKDASRCYFVKTTWTEVSDLLCDQFNESLFNIGLYQLLIAILAIPYTITLLVLNRRLGGHGPILGNAYGVDTKAVELADSGGSYYGN